MFLILIRFITGLYLESLFETFDFSFDIKTRLNLCILININVLSI